MTLRGRVKNGKVVLDDSKILPDGTEVVVRPTKTNKPRSRNAKATKRSGRPQSLAQRLAPFIGKAKGLPPDMAVNLDHYLYGLPKRK